MDKTNKTVEFLANEEEGLIISPNLPIIKDH